MERHIYSIKKVAELLSVHQKTVLRYIKEGRLKANKVGGRWRIHGNDLTSFVGFKNIIGFYSPVYRSIADHFSLHDQSEGCRSGSRVRAIV